MVEHRIDTPVQLLIRKVIFERFNDPESRFTNDEVLEALMEDGDPHPPWAIDDLEDHFADLCRCGVARSIAQNFTTIWLKLFDSLEAIRCGSCGRDIHVCRREEETCPNPECRAPI